MGKKEFRHVQALQRRHDYLVARILTSDKDLSFDKAEVSALKWAIEQLAPREPSRKALL